MQHEPRAILISRTDKIGDVVLTLPLAGYLKQKFPQVRIVFLAQKYTEPVVRASTQIDDVWVWDDIRNLGFAETCDLIESARIDTILHVFPRPEIAWWAWRMRIRRRMGTSHRWYHWLTCNRMFSLARKNSNLHESQLNLEFVRALCPGTPLPSLSEIPELYGLHRYPPCPVPEVADDRFNLVLHPLSFGSAREWPLRHFASLIHMLEKEPVRILLTGGHKEKEPLDAFIREFQVSNAVNLAGRLTLEELVGTLARCQGIVACSTGPLHIGAALGLATLGLYPPIRPMHPERWGPVGARAHALTAKPSCDECRHDPSQCACMTAISPEAVFAAICQWWRPS